MTRLLMPILILILGGCVLPTRPLAPERLAVMSNTSELLDAYAAVQRHFNSLTNNPWYGDVEAYRRAIRARVAELHELPADERVVFIDGAFWRGAPRDMVLFTWGWPHRRHTNHSPFGETEHFEYGSYHRARRVTLHNGTVLWWSVEHP